MYSSVTGKAKQLLEVLTIEDLKQENALDLVWALLDKCHEKMEHEREDKAYERWEQAHRRHGQDMNEWCTHLRKSLLELRTQDPETVISDKQLASKMLRGSGISQKEQAQVLFNCGGQRDADKTETVLNVTFPRLLSKSGQMGVYVRTNLLVETPLVEGYMFIR